MSRKDMFRGLSAVRLTSLGFQTRALPLMVRIGLRKCAFLTVIHDSSALIIIHFLSFRNLRSAPFFPFSPDDRFGKKPGNKQAKSKIEMAAYPCYDRKNRSKEM